MAEDRTPIEVKESILRLKCASAGLRHLKGGHPVNCSCEICISSVHVEVALYHLLKVANGR
jgi:hypothetical protein